MLILVMVRYSFIKFRSILIDILQNIVISVSIPVFIFRHMAYLSIVTCMCYKLTFAVWLLDMEGRSCTVILDRCLSLQLCFRPLIYDLSVSILCLLREGGRDVYDQIDGWFMDRSIYILDTDVYR